MVEAEEDPLLAPVKDLLGLTSPEAPTIINGGIVLGISMPLPAFRWMTARPGKPPTFPKPGWNFRLHLANGHPYPGTVHNVVHQVFGDNIFVAWVGKYCEGGTPLYFPGSDRGCSLLR